MTEQSINPKNNFPLFSTRWSILSEAFSTVPQKDFDRFQVELANFVAWLAGEAIQEIMNHKKKTLEIKA